MAGLVIFLIWSRCSLQYYNQMTSAEEGPSDQNSSKHENSYSKLGGPVFTPKFGTLTLDKEESADGVKSNKYLRTSQEICFNIFGNTWRPESSSPARKYCLIYFGDAWRLGIPHVKIKEKQEKLEERRYAYTCNTQTCTFSYLHVRPISIFGHIYS